MLHRGNIEDQRREKQRTAALVQEIESQSDRGAAIIAVAWVEEALDAAVRSFLQHDADAMDRLFRQSGPLSTFSAKIDLARLLGMTTAVITKDLHNLRKIRNDFAHSVLEAGNAPLTFESPSIRSRSLSLASVAHEGPYSPRLAFLATCFMLNSDFNMHRFFSEKVNDAGQIFAPIEELPQRKSRDGMC